MSQGNTVVANVGNLAVGGSAFITVSVQAPATPGSLNDTSFVSGDQTDSNTNNNYAAIKTGVLSVPSLATARGRQSGVHLDD